MRKREKLILLLFLINLLNSDILYSPAFLYAGANLNASPVPTKTPRVARTGFILSSFFLSSPLKERPLKDEFNELLFKGLSIFRLFFKDMNPEGTEFGDSFSFCRCLTVSYVNLLTNILQSFPSIILYQIFFFYNPMLKKCLQN